MATTRCARAVARRDAAATDASAAAARIPVRKTYKLYVGGQFPRSESGRQLRRPRAGRHAAGQRRALVAQGRARRDPDGARRRGRLVGQDGDEPRPGPLPRGRADGGAPRAIRRGGRRGRGPDRGRAPQRRSIGRSIAGSGTRAGPTRSARSWARSTRSRAPYFNFSIPEPTGVVGIVAPESLVAARARVARRAGRRRRQRRRRARVGVAAAAGGDAGRGAGHVRRAAGRDQHPDRPAPRARPDRRRAHGRQRARHLGRAARHARSRSRSPPSRTSSAWRGRRAASTSASTGSTTAAPSGRSGSPRFLEIKTVWHPIGM